MTHLELLDLIAELEREWSCAKGISRALRELAYAVRADQIPALWPATHYREREIRSLESL